MGVHGFDLINYFTGSTIESIHSRSTSLIDAKIKEIGLPDHALASFRLTNGVIGTLHITLRAAYGYD
jgi:predicted dehydrogenase